MSIPSRRRSRSARVSAAIALIIGSIVASAALLMGSFLGMMTGSLALVPAWAVSLGCGIIAVWLMHRQMIVERDHDAHERAKVAAANRDSAVAASRENAAFVGVLHDKIRAGQTTITQLTQSRDQERSRADRAEARAREQSRRADELAGLVDQAETRIAELHHTISQHAEADWQAFNASYIESDQVVRSDQT